MGLSAEGSVCVLQAKELQPSEVVDNDTGEAENSTVRTSTGTFYERGANEVLPFVT
jgi:hypothetical protein